MEDFSYRVKPHRFIAFVVSADCDQMFKARKLYLQSTIILKKCTGDYNMFNEIFRTSFSCLVTRKLVLLVECLHFARLFSPAPGFQKRLGE